MLCEALHSQLLFSLMIIHAIIITYLFLSNMFHIYNMKSPENETGNVTISPKEDLDVNALKVVVAIIAHILSILTIFASLLENNLKVISKRLPSLVVVITLVFALVFNVVASICMWFHDAPHLPGGYSRTIRGCAVLSSAVCLFTLVISVTLCTHPPTRVSYKSTAVKDINVLKESKESKSDDRDKIKKNTQAAISSPKLKEVQSPALPAATSPEPIAPVPVPLPPSIVPPHPPAAAELPPPPPAAAEPPPPPPAATDEKKRGEGEGLYENLEVPPADQLPPLAPPPPP